jgi:ribonuclease HI
MLIFTDGGCIGNGTKKARASFAVYMNNTIIRGHVMPFEYSYHNGILTYTTNEIKPSNNRGELLSLIHAFIEIIKNDLDDIIVYSDSQICVKTINEWYPNRLKKGTIHEFKNLDLIKIMMFIYNNIKEHKNIKILHTRGHQKLNKNITEEQKKIIDGNCIVDKYASDILKVEKIIEYEIIYL